MTYEDLVREVRRNRAAILALADAVDELAERGERTPCNDHDRYDFRLWSSDHEDDRAQAITLCQGCPVMVQCGDAATARHEPQGVWGARDFSDRRKGKRLGRATSPELVAST